MRMVVVFRTVGAEVADDAPTRHGELQPVECDDVAEALRQRPAADHRIRHSGRNVPGF